MNDFRKMIDPLMFGIKLRDTLETKDLSHISNYIRDAAEASKKDEIRKNSRANMQDSAEFSRNIQDLITQSLLPMKGTLGGMPTGLPEGMFGGSPGLGGLSGLNEYIQNIINQSLKLSQVQPIQQPVAQAKDTRSAEVILEEQDEGVKIFEAHDYVIVRIAVPPNINERQVRVRIGMNKLMIKWAPRGKEQIVNLPYDVKNEGLSATMKNRTLEVSIPKEHNPDTRQIDIRFS
ncbi:MAG: Hsp20/alpha crystallin family protein [Bacillota bacterium]